MKLKILDWEKMNVKGTIILLLIFWKFLSREMRGGGGGGGTNKEYIMGFLILVKTFSLPAEPFLTRRERQDSAEIVLNFY